MAQEADSINNGMQVHTLDVLRRLVTGSSELDAEQQQKFIDNTSIELVDAEIAKLRERKEQLTRQLKEVKRKTVKELVMDDLQGKIVKHKTSTLPEEALDRLPIIAKKRKLDLVKVTQAICGFTTFEEGSELVLRLETCYQGYYYEHFQIYLELDHNQKLRISHHTVPYFIPIDRIQKKYLNSDIKTFIHTMSDYLNSFVARRQQLINLADCETVQFNRLKTSQPSDYMTVEVEHGEKKYFMQLYYENLLNTRPSKVDIITLDEGRKKQRATHLYPFFLEHDLKDAFELAFPRIDPNTTTRSDAGNGDTSLEITSNDPDLGLDDTTIG
eukprot:Phypoly_transcript_12122.p1 GENE.Phypoly_transcript_12122~~Phypoly_transcript_12122.p1  ORF type:complete len:328 (+),score=67.09 Phypoly_transcript_12122:75-1058(+)